MYGFQWRHFGAAYTDMHADYSGQVSWMLLALSVLQPQIPLNLLLSEQPSQKAPALKAE